MGFATIFSWLGSFLGGPLVSMFSSVTDLLKSNKVVEGTEFAAMTSADRDEYIALVKAQTELNTIKASNSWWGAHLMVYLFGLPAAMHWIAVFMCSTWKGADQIFGWFVPALPGQYAGAEQQIALSFFILAPTLPIISSLQQRIRGG